jgi:hypothetical protein
MWIVDVDVHAVGIDLARHADATADRHTAGTHRDVGALAHRILDDRVVDAVQAGEVPQELADVVHDADSAAVAIVAAEVRDLIERCRQHDHAIAEVGAARRRGPAHAVTAVDGGVAVGVVAFAAGAVGIGLARARDLAGDATDGRAHAVLVALLAAGTRHRLGALRTLMLMAGVRLVARRSTVGALAVGRARLGARRHALVVHALVGRLARGGVVLRARDARSVGADLMQRVARAAVLGGLARDRGIAVAVGGALEIGGHAVAELRALLALGALRSIAAGIALHAALLRLQARVAPVGAVGALRVGVAVVEDAGPLAAVVVVARPDRVVAAGIEPVADGAAQRHRHRVAVALGTRREREREPTQTQGTHEILHDHDRHLPPKVMVNASPETTAKGCRPESGPA